MVRELSDGGHLPACCAAGNLSSMMQSSNGPLEAMHALGSISSGSAGAAGMVPAAMQLAQRGALGGPGAYPAMLQQQYLQSLPWLLRMQVRQN